MDRRLTKQIIIALVFFALLTSIGGAIYFVHRPAATCFDGRKNQGELDVDCGGPCIPCALKNNPPLSISQSPQFIYSANKKKVDIIFKISNTSMSWGVKNFAYKVAVLGKSGEKQEFMEASFILPHEVKTFILSQLDVAFPIAKVTVTIDPQTIVWAKPIEGVNLDAGDPFVLSNVKIIHSQTKGYTYQPYNPNSLNIHTFTKTLRPGMSGTEVKYLQKVLALDSTIYPEKRVSGYYGKLTEAAVKRFQKKYGIRTTGEVGKLTRAQLNELYGRKPVTHYQNAYTFTKTLKRGMRGQEVYNLQKVLHWDPRIYPEGEMSGYFGVLTERAVKRFQKKYGIRTTGQVGPQTRGKLNEIYAQHISAGEENLGSEEISLQVKGEVYNSTPFNWRQGNVGIILCDKQHHYLAVGITSLANIYSNKSTSFVIQWYRSSFPSFPSDVTICEKMVNVNVLNPDNAFVTSP